VHNNYIKREIVGWTLTYKRNTKKRRTFPETHFSVYVVHSIWSRSLSARNLNDTVLRCPLTVLWDPIVYPVSPRTMFFAPLVYPITVVGGWRGWRGQFRARDVLIRVNERVIPATV